MTDPAAIDPAALSITRWIAVLTAESTKALEARPLPDDCRHDYRVTAEPCEKHEGGCVKVCYGFLAEHFRAAEHRPADLARELVSRLVGPGPDACAP